MGDASRSVHMCVWTASKLLDTARVDCLPLRATTNDITSDVTAACAAAAAAASTPEAARVADIEYYICIANMCDGAR